MSKKHKKQDKVPKEFKLKKKHLTYDEVRDYEKIGIPDFSQNYLELFSRDVIDDLIMLSKSSSDNQDKAFHMIDELEDLGFEALGLGTNVLTLINPIYPGVVFKIALDYYGIADNINDEWLSEAIPHYAKFITRDPTGMVSVQQRYTVIKSPQRIETLRDEILPVLNKLSKKYLVIDLGLNNFLNYGIDRNGEFVFVDGSDLFPIADAKSLLVCPRGVGFRGNSRKVKRCKGRLVYDEQFHELVCQKCGARYNPAELRPEKGVSDMAEVISDGLTNEERFELEREAIERILKRKGGEQPASLADEMRKYECPDDPDDDSEIDEQHIQYEGYDCEEEAVGDIDDAINRKIKALAESNEVEIEAFERPEQDDDDDDEYVDFVKEVRRNQDVSDVDSIKPTARVGNVSEPEEPGIRFEIRDGGIYLISSGDFNTNYEKDGIPIFISLDNGQEYTLLANSWEFKEFLDDRIREAKQNGRL